MNERLKKVREYLKKFGLEEHMRDFSEKVGVTHGSISLLETGKRGITTQFVKALCGAFPDINEDWMLTGKGKMIKEKDRETEIADAVAKIYKANDPFITELIKILANTSEEDWDVMKSIANRLAEASKEKNNLPE